MATRDTGGQQKATRTREETDEVEASVDTEAAERHKEMTEDVDSLLDEIDEVLESNSKNLFGSTYKKGVSETVRLRNSDDGIKVLPRTAAMSVRSLSSPRTRNSRDGYAFYCRTMREGATQTSRDGAEPESHEAPSSRALSSRTGHKWCPDCGEVLPLSASGETPRRDRSDVVLQALPQRARSREPKNWSAVARTTTCSRRYGITADEADALLEDQDGLCAICKVAPAPCMSIMTTRPVRVRALLCFNCNGGLGQFKDDPAAAACCRLLRPVPHAAAAGAREQYAAGNAPEGASRPGTPPVGSQRRPGTQRTSARTTGRSSGTRRREQAGEADE